MIRSYFVWRAMCSSLVLKAVETRKRQRAKVKYGDRSHTMNDSTFGIGSFLMFAKYNARVFIRCIFRSVGFLVAPSKSFKTGMHNSWLKVTIKSPHAIYYINLGRTNHMPHKKNGVRMKYRLAILTKKMSLFFHVFTIFANI